ncbi:MAG: two-component system sensor histidine kinase NtrB [Rickettsiales bacterium]
MNADPKAKKPLHHFPAPEWTGVSASLAAALAHEIRNPLLSIKGAAQLLEQAVAEADDKILAQLIITEARRIEQLVATLDPLTPNPAETSVPLNIHEITEYVRLAARTFSPGIAIATDYDPSLPPVLGRREGLIQALINLVKNACEAVSNSGAGGAPLPWERQRGLASASELSRSGEGGDPQNSDALRPQPKNAEGHFSTSPKGEVSPAALSGFTPTITLSTRYLVGERMQRAGGGRLPIKLSVSDNGPGVPDAMIPRLFTPFHSDKREGRGLGLAIVAKIAEDHGGLVAYEGAAGRGAVFSLYLPAA